MFSTVHGTVGAIIGQSTGNIWLAFFGGLISHFLLDAIPHGDEKLITDLTKPTKREIFKVGVIAILDNLLLLALLAALLYTGKLPAEWAVLSGVVGGILPDVNSAYYFLTRRCPIFKPMFDLHFWFHRLFIHFEMTLWQGIIFQLLIEAALIYIVLI